jgi:alpha-2-macroglobulin
VQGRPDFRQGYLNLPVEPVERTLNVELLDIGRGTSLAETPVLGPGDELTLGIRVTDQAGQPVEGEFSLSVVDLAVLALAEPNALDITPALYGERPLAVKTGLGLAAYAHRRGMIADGVGGGGGGEGMLLAVVRERFPDTAYWNAAVTTNANGEAQVNLTLPDTLTTWRVQARGLTIDSKVGDAVADIVATKQLLVRPVVPRFLVRDDHVQLSAVVHNNTDTQLEVEVSLQATAIQLDDPARMIQTVTIPAEAGQIWIGGERCWRLILPTWYFQQSPAAYKMRPAPRPALSRSCAIPSHRLSPPRVLWTAAASVWSWSACPNLSSRTAASSISKCPRPWEQLF